jgi:hypothetical protein
LLISAQDFRIIPASHFWCKHDKKYLDHHEIQTPQNNNLTGHHFLNFMPATFAIASPGSLHCSQSYIALLMPGLSQHQSSWSITPAEFGCVFMQPHNLISLCSNTSCIYGPSLAPPPSQSTNYIHLLPHNSVYFHSTLENEVPDLATQHGYHINCNNW